MIQVEDTWASIRFRVFLWHLVVSVRFWLLQTTVAVSVFETLSFVVL